ncbi:hypothetical protein ACIBAI_26595 [Streptomyces sp. NPDC051041]|uniref:hypothetical protein n=1 Tax=Streptomyces sp. NPDC051041 TaxID=3365640 RepID=UPI0037950485
MRFGGRGFGRLAAHSLPSLSALAAVWRPDVVIGGTLSFAAPLLAARLGIPGVRQAWDLGEPAEMDHGAVEELAPELGADALAEPALRVHLGPRRLLAPELSGLRCATSRPGGSGRWRPGCWSVRSVRGCA